MKTRKLTTRQQAVIDRWKQNPEWLIVEVKDPYNQYYGFWFFKDPLALLTERVHRWVFGGLQFRGLLELRESNKDRAYYALRAEP